MKLLPLFVFTNFLFCFWSKNLRFFWFVFIGLKPIVDDWIVLWREKKKRNSNFLPLNMKKIKLEKEKTTKTNKKCMMKKLFVSVLIHQRESKVTGGL